MKRLIVALLMVSMPALRAQSAGGTELVMSSVQGSKVPIAVLAPQSTGVDPQVLRKEFHEVVTNDLDESGNFSVLRKDLPAADPSATKAWLEAGAQLLMTTTVTRAGQDYQFVVQVVDLASAQEKKAGAFVLRKQYTGLGDAFRRIAHRVADDLVERLTGVPGVSASRVVFVREVSRGVKELFRVDRDGAGLMQLTNFGSLTLSPTVSARDGRLAFVTYKGGAPEIWGQRTLGGDFVRLYPLAGSPKGHCYAPAWSPDGKRLAFSQGDRRGNSDIVVLDVESGRARKLTDSNCINTEPVWNPAGNNLAFTSDREGGPQVYLMEDDGSNVRRLTREGTYNTSPAWSPLGGMIAYVSRFEGKFDLFVYKLGEGKSYQVTTGVASSESPSWSPDERRIVFSSGSRGGMQLYTTDLSGNTLHKLTTFEGCQSPKWTKSR